MKKAVKYKNIHNLEDLRKVKLKLEKKIRLTEKSISEKTDFGKLLLGTFQKMGNISSDKINGPEVIGYLFPAALHFILKNLKNDLSKKQIKRLMVYTVIGGLVAFTFYKVLGKRQTDTEE